MSKRLDKRKAKLKKRQDAHASVKDQGGRKKPGSMNGRK